MVSPDPLFPFRPLLWSTRASGRVIFVSDNVSDSLSDDIEKYLLPRYLDARDRARNIPAAGRRSEDFPSASLGPRALKYSSNYFVPFLNS